MQQTGILILLSILMVSFDPYKTYAQVQHEGDVLEHVLTPEDLKDLSSGSVIIRRMDAPNAWKAVSLIAATAIAATAEQIFETLIDCEGFPTFLPHIEGCHNEYPGGADPTSMKTFDQWQRVRISLAGLNWELAFTHRMAIEFPYLIAWELRDGDLEESTGYWRIIPVADNESILVQRILINPGTRIPPRLQEILIRRDLRAMVQAMKTEVLLRRSQRATESSLSS
jgi:ribosome-associated toxin RatA of RatAB toxin-antitoxin module